MSKQIDSSALPDGFLIERWSNVNGRGQWAIERMSPLIRAGINNLDDKIRPLLDYWCFNDGSMTLPDGLVVEAKFSDHIELTLTSGNSRLLRNMSYSGSSDLFITAVKIWGVTAEYGEQLDMEVVEL